MSHQLKWAINLAPSPFGLYSVTTIFGRYHAVITPDGQDHRIGGDFLTPAKAKAACQADYTARMAPAQKGKA